jgi:hypothetical protein
VNAITFYRGIHDAEEYDILESLNKREQIVRIHAPLSVSGNYSAQFICAIMF